MVWKTEFLSFINGFERGKVDIILFCKNSDSQFLLVQVYVDDIIFGATNEMLCKEFSKLVWTKFEMSMMGELKFFLGLIHFQSKAYL